MANILTRMGQRPKWKYERGVNTILYTTAKRSVPEWEKLLIAIIAAVFLGLFVRALPENISLVLQQGIVEPLLDTFLGFLNAVAGPMIFLSVVWGIYSIGDASTFSEIGRRLCARFLLFMCLMTVLIALISLLFFNLKSGNAQDGNQFSELYHMVLDVIPDNLVTPFSNNNTLQILFIGFIVGITMLIIGKNVQSVADLTEQFGSIVDGIMGFVGKLVPVFVFGSLFSTIVKSDRSSLSEGGKFLAGTLLGCLFLILIHTVIACIRMHMSPLDLWKRTFST